MDLPTSMHPIALVSPVSLDQISVLVRLSSKNSGKFVCQSSLACLLVHRGHLSGGCAVVNKREQTTNHLEATIFSSSSFCVSSAAARFLRLG